MQGGGEEEDEDVVVVVGVRKGVKVEGTPVVVMDEGDGGVVSGSSSGAPPPPDPPMEGGLSTDIKGRYMDVAAWHRATLWCHDAPHEVIAHLSSH